MTVNWHIKEKGGVIWFHLASSGQSFNSNVQAAALLNLNSFNLVSEKSQKWSDGCLKPDTAFYENYISISSRSTSFDLVRCVQGMRSKVNLTSSTLKCSYRHLTKLAKARFQETAAKLRAPTKHLTPQARTSFQPSFLPFPLITCNMWHGDQSAGNTVVYTRSEVVCFCLKPLPVKRELFLLLACRSCWVSL